MSLGGQNFSGGRGFANISLGGFHAMAKPVCILPVQVQCNMKSSKVLAITSFFIVCWFLTCKHLLGLIINVSFLEKKKKTSKISS